MYVEFDVVLEQGETGMWIASVPGLDGCHTQGRTEAEAMHRVEEAIALCLESQRPRTVRLTRVTVP